MYVIRIRHWCCFCKHIFTSLPPLPQPPFYSTFPISTTTLLFLLSHLHNHPSIPPFPSPQPPFYSSFPISTTTLLFLLSHLHNHPSIPPFPSPQPPFYSSFPISTTTLLFLLSHLHNHPSNSPFPSPQPPILLHSFHSIHFSSRPIHFHLIHFEHVFSYIQYRYEYY